MSAPRADIWLRRAPPARTALGWAVCSAAATHERWRSASRSDVQPGGLDNDPQHRRHGETEGDAGRAREICRRPAAGMRRVGESTQTSGTRDPLPFVCVLSPTLPPRVARRGRSAERVFPNLSPSALCPVIVLSAGAPFTDLDCALGSAAPCSARVRGAGQKAGRGSIQRPPFVLRTPAPPCLRLRGLCRSPRLLRSFPLWS